MNKTAIYALSVLIILVLGLSVITPGIQMAEAFAGGFKEGFEAGRCDDTQENTTTLPYTITFKPSVNQVIHSKDSIEFADGKIYPVVIHQASISVPDSKFPIWAAWASAISFLTSLVLLIILIWKFVKFIINITKERIFVDINARYLRQLSFCLIGISLLQIASIAIDEFVLSQFNLRLAGYELSSSSTFPWGNMLIGLICLLISVIWTRAVLIKREQELTI